MIRPLLLLALVGSGALALAQSRRPATVAEPGPAADRYHEAARLYVDGDLDAAGRAADAGLALAPADARMHALHELIRRQQPQDGGGGERPDPPPPGGGGADDGEPPPDVPDESPGGPTDGPTGEPSGRPDAPAPQASDRPQAPPPRPGQMTPEQAERLLDAVGGDEQLLLRSMRREPSRVRQNERTW